MSKVVERERKLIMDYGATFEEFRDLLKDIGLEYDWNAVNITGLLERKEISLVQVKFKCNALLYRRLLVELRQINRAHKKKDVWIVD